MTNQARARPRRALFTTITDYHGGAERVSLTLARHLASRPGWQVEVFVVCAKLPMSFTARMLPANVRVRYGPWRNWHLSYAVAPLRLIGRRYDLVFSSFIYINGLISILRKLQLIRIGRLVLRESTSVFDRSSAKPRLFNFFYRRYGAADQVIAQTGYMAEHILPFIAPQAARRLTKLANPIDLPAIDAAAAEPLDAELRERLAGRTNILFCGRLIDVKRPDLALEAFRIATAGDSRTQLVVLGNGPLEEDLRRRAHQAGLADRVLFLGYRPNPHAVMAACHYGLLTSSREGFPNVVLEMMAAGIRKIVMTPCAGDLDQLGEVAITATSDVDEIAGALKKALYSGEDYRSNYRAVVRKRSVSAFLDNILGRRLRATKLRS